MVLTAATAYEHARHALGSTVTGAEPRDLVNQAGLYFTGMHRWNWLVRPPVTLNFIAPITFTGATWTESSKTITLAAAFTRYTFKPSDRVEITAGTPTADVLTGSYQIASKASDNAITTIDSISPTGANLTGVAGSISFPYTSDLPTDFSEIVGYDASASTQSFQLVTWQQILEYRTRAIPPGNLSMFGAVEWVGPSSPTVSGAPLPRIALYPTPTSFLLNALSVQYRASWVPVGEDQSICVLPPWCEALFIQVVRAMAKGYDEDDEEVMSSRLMAVVGPLFDAARRRDGMVQPSFGLMRGGAMSSPSRYPPNSVPLGGVGLV